MILVRPSSVERPQHVGGKHSRGHAFGPNFTNLVQNIHLHENSEKFETGLRGVRKEVTWSNPRNKLLNTLGP